MTFISDIPGALQQVGILWTFTAGEQAYNAGESPRARPTSPSAGGIQWTFTAGKLAINIIGARQQVGIQWTFTAGKRAYNAGDSPRAKATSPSAGGAQWTFTAGKLS